MCYSGKCLFENHMGDCMIYAGIIGFKIHFGWSPCTLGGFATDPEEEEYIKEQEHNLVFLYARQRAVNKFLKGRNEYGDVL